MRKARPRGAPIGRLSGGGPARRAAPRPGAPAVNQPEGGLPLAGRGGRGRLRAGRGGGAGEGGEGASPGAASSAEPRAASGRRARRHGGLRRHRQPACRHRQRLGGGEGWLRRRPDPQVLLPQLCGPPEARPRHGRGAGGRPLHRAQSRGAPGPPGHPLPHGARRGARLERHGAHLAVRLLQGPAADLLRGAPGAAHRGAPQPQQEPGEGGRGLLRDLQRAGALHLHASGAEPVRHGPHHGGGAGRRRRRDPRRAHLRGLRHAPLHHAGGRGRARRLPLPPAAAAQGRRRLPHLGRVRGGQDHQGASLLPLHQPPEGRGAGDGEGAVHPARRQHPRRGSGAFPSSGAAFPTGSRRRRERGHPRGAGFRHPEVRPGPAAHALRQHRPLRRLHALQRFRGPAAQRGEETRPQGHQNQDLGPPGAVVLHVDRRLHPGLAGHLQEDVGVQEGVRGGRGAGHAPQDVLGGGGRSSAPPPPCIII